MISCAYLRVFLTVLVLASGASGVIAAEDPLFGRLADLTVSKGDKNAQVGKICLALGLPVKKDGSCLVYQTLAKDESGRLHSINVLNRVGKTTRSVFVFLHDDLVGKAWLIDEAGRLEKAASGIYKNEWTWTEVPINKGQRTDLPRKSIIGAPKSKSWRMSRIEKIDRTGGSARISQPPTPALRVPGMRHPLSYRPPCPLNRMKPYIVPIA